MIIKECLGLHGEYCRCENRDLKQHEFTFDFYNEKQFKDLNNDNITVIGNVNVEKDRIDFNENNDISAEITFLRTNILSFNASGELYDYKQFNSYFEIKEPDDSVKVLGYVRVGKYEYVRIEDTGLLAILIPLVVGTIKPQKWYMKWLVLIGCLVLGLGVGIWYINSGKENDVPLVNNSHLGIEGGKDWDGRIQQDFKGENGMDYFETVGAISQTINAENRTVQIVNTGRYGKYLCSVTVSLCGEVINGEENLYDEAVDVYETKPILPGKAVEWDLYGDLSSELENGVYMFRFLYSIYDIETGENGTVYAGNLVGEIPVEYSRITLIK